MNKIYSKKETLALFIIWGIFVYLIFNNITRILIDSGFFIGTLIDVSPDNNIIIEITIRIIILLTYILIGLYLLKTNKEDINIEVKAFTISMRNLKLTAMVFAITFIVNIVVSDFKGSALTKYMIEKNIKYDDLFIYYRQINGLFNFLEMLTVLTIFLVIIFRKGNLRIGTEANKGS